MTTAASLYRCARTERGRGEPRHQPASPRTPPHPHPPASVSSRRSRPASFWRGRREVIRASRRSIPSFHRTLDIICQEHPGIHTRIYSDATDSATSDIPPLISWSELHPACRPEAVLQPERARHKRHQVVRRVCGLVGGWARTCWLCFRCYQGWGAGQGWSERER